MAYTKETAGVSAARRSLSTVAGSVQDGSVSLLLSPLTAFGNLSIRDNYLPFCDKTIIVQNSPLTISCIGRR